MKFSDLINSTVNEKRIHYKSQKLQNRKLIVDTNFYKELKIYPNSDLCPLCNNDLIILNIRSSKDAIQGRRCSNCKHIFLSKKHYKFVYDYNKQRKLRNDISIMEYNKLSSGDITEPIKNHKVEESNLKYTYVSANILYVMNNDINKCPIHNIKMEVKLVSYGKKYKDTLYFCRQCNKYIISLAHSTVLKQNSEKIYDLRKIIYRELL